MCKHITFLGSINKQKNIRALELLDKLEGVNVERVEAIPFLEEIINPPYIRTDEGARFYGLTDIEFFVNGQLNFKNRST